MKSYFMRVIAVPSTVVLSVFFGGAFGSGREVVQFMSQHGPYGGFISMATIWFVYALCLFFCFELARKFKAYDYRTFFQHLLGKGWVLYEILILVGLVVALAICASSVGAIASDHFSLPAMVGSIILLTIVVVLNYLGRQYVEKSMMYCVAVLACILIYLFFDVVINDHELLLAKFAADSPDFSAIFSGLQYGFSNSGFIPILLYCCIDLKSRKETFVAALIAGYVSISPAISLHTLLMVGYPEVINQEVPTYWVLEQIETATFVNVYVTIVCIMIAQTGVGLLQGFVERIDGFAQQKTGKKLPALGHAGVSTVAFIASLALASMGLVQLVFKGYTFFSAAFFVVFFIPLFTYGAFRIFWERGDKEKMVKAKTNKFFI